MRWCYGVTVSVVTTWVMPGVRFDVIEATEFQEPCFFEVMSYGIATCPPAVGPLRTGRYSVLFAGAEGMFFPLEPSRFSAPQLIAEPGSPAPAFAVPYEIVSCSPAGVVLLRVARRIQISPVCVVALLKFLTLSKSMISQSLVELSVRTLT